MFLLLCFSLISEESNYKEIYHFYIKSIQEGDRNLMMSISSQLELLISDVYEKYQFFHLFVLTSSALGKYGRIEILLDKVENVYNNRFEYWFVKGMALERKGQDGTLFFNMAYEKFLQEYGDKNLVHIFLVYLSLLIGKDIDSTLLPLNDNEKRVADNYFKLNREELLRVSPFNLFHYEPITFLEGKTDKDWWK